MRVCILNCHNENLKFSDIDSELEIKSLLLWHYTVKRKILKITRITSEHSTHTNKSYNGTKAVILLRYKYENLYNKNELIKTS